MADWSTRNMEIIQLPPEEAAVRARVLARLILRAAVKREIRLGSHQVRGSIPRNSNGRHR